MKWEPKESQYIILNTDENIPPSVPPPQFQRCHYEHYQHMMCLLQSVILRHSQVWFLSKKKKGGYVKCHDTDIEKDSLAQNNLVSWPANHANRQATNHQPLSPISIWPFSLNRHTAQPNIAHAMELVEKAIQHLHPGQIPFITMGQRKFSIASKFNWHGLIPLVRQSLLWWWEDSILRRIFLLVSGWISVLVQSEVTTSAWADAILTAYHVTRSYYAHHYFNCCSSSTSPNIGVPTLYWITWSRGCCIGFQHMGQYLC